MEKIILLARKIYRHFMHDSLYRNSIYLIINTAVSAITGFLFWTITAHLFSTANVGRATALIAAVALISSLSNLGLAKTVIRFLIKSKNKSQDILTKILISAGAAFVFSIIISFLLPLFKVSHAGMGIVVLLIISGIVTVLKNLADNIFIAFRAAGHTLIENIVTNLSKLLLVFIVVSWGYVGIFISQIGGALLGLILCLYLLIYRHGVKFMTRPSVKTMSGLWSFSIGSYLNDIIGGLPSTVVPLLIIAKIGPSNAAFWYIAMQIATVLFLISNSINQSLFAEAANKEEYLLHYTSQAAKAMFGVLVPASIIVIAFAPVILSIFGSEYQQAAGVLRLLAVSSLLVAGNYVTGTVLNMFRKIWYLAIVNTANAAVVIGGCIVFGKTLNVFGAVWMAGEIVNILLFGIGAIYVLQNRNMLFTNKIRS